MNRTYKIEVKIYVFQKADSPQQAIKRARNRGNIPSQAFIGKVEIID